jgi:RNA polymerase sigma-54 factor
MFFFASPKNFEIDKGERNASVIIYQHMPELGQFTSLRQTLALAPQMHQSLKILQANTLELQQIAAAQLNANPLLEELKPETETVSLDDPETYRPAASASNEGRDLFFNSIPEHESFQEHLRNQGAFDIDDEDVLAAFNFLADFLDERGFISREAEEEAIDEGFSREVINKAVDFMQNCEPAGVGARSVWENYMIQLRKRHRQNSLAYAILE